MSLNFNGNYIGGIPSGGGEGGTTDHAQLTNLDYANSGHTGFMKDDASNLTTDGQKVFDGAWVDHYKSIVDSASAPTANAAYDLSEELPDDNYIYNVQFDVWANAGSTTGNRVRLSFKGGFLTSQYYAISTRNIDSTAQTGMITFNLPISTARKLTAVAYSDNVGTFGLSMLGYRRVGTNS